MDVKALSLTKTRSVTTNQKNEKNRLLHIIFQTECSFRSISRIWRIRQKSQQYDILRNIYTKLHARKNFYSWQRCFHTRVTKRVCTYMSRFVCVEYNSSYSYRADWHYCQRELVDWLLGSLKPRYIIIECNIIRVVSYPENVYLYGVSFKSRFSLLSNLSMSAIVCKINWSCRKSSPCLKMAMYSLLSIVKNVSFDGISADLKRLAL